MPGLTAAVTVNNRDFTLCSRLLDSNSVHTFIQLNIRICRYRPPIFMDEVNSIGSARIGSAGGSGCHSNTKHVCTMHSSARQQLLPTYDSTYMCTTVIMCVQWVCRKHAPSIIFMDAADSIGNSARIDRSSHGRQQNMASHFAALCQTALFTCVQLYSRICREHAPSIIFMDEVDSIGSARSDSGGGGGGGDSEVQRTMLELLNQLDGFEATNKIKVSHAISGGWLLSQGDLQHNSR